MPNPIDKLLGRDSNKKEDDDGLKEMFADARRRRGVPPEGYTSSDSDQNERDDISAFFSNHPFFGGRSPFGVRGEGDSPASSLFENLMSHSQSSSYQIHQDGKEVTIDVDLPGVSAKELKVEVLQNIQSCVVSWSGQRKQRNSHSTDQQQYGRHPHQTSSSSFSSFNNRLRLGPQVDCDKLTANLSHGILTMKAPVKELQETATVRNVEVTEHDQN